MSSERSPKRGLAGWGLCLSVFATAACSGTDETGATPSGSARTTAPTQIASPTSESSTTPSTSRPPSGVRSCQALLNHNWVPPVAEPEVGYDPESGIADIQLGAHSYKFDVLNDEACKQLPFLGPIIKRLLKTASEISD